MSGGRDQHTEVALAVSMNFFINIPLTQQSDI